MTSTQAWSTRGSTQIDLVAVREDGWTDVGECKWGVVRSLRPVLRELCGKAGLFPNRRGATLGHLLFTRDAVRTPAAGATCYSLAQLYE